MVFRTLRKVVCPRFTLRTNLLILLGIVGALLIADRIREIVAERNAEMAEARLDLAEFARRAALSQSDLLGEARALLRLAASLPERQVLSLTGCQVPFRHLVQDRPWLLSLAVIDSKGQPVCTSADRLVSKSVADRSYFRAALATRDFVVSEYIISRVTGRPIIAAAMPRIADGNVGAVMVASIDIHWLSRLAAEAGESFGAEVLLVDRTGTIIAAYPEPERWVGKDISGDAEFWSVLRGPEGVVETMALDGKERIVGHTELPETGALIAVMRERHEVLGEADRNARFALGKIGLTALFCFLIVWLGGERLVLRPIEAMTAAAKRIGAHDLSARVDTSGFSPELGLLGGTLNDMAVQLAEREMELKRANLRLSELAATDGLTGLANRRRFDEHLNAEWRRNSRTGESLSLLALDVDHFKRFNDRYGHLEGDACLRAVAEVLKGAGRRPPDLAARTGGEEFALLLPGAKMDDAARIGEQIRAAIWDLEIEHLDSEFGRVTVSVGVATLIPRAGQNVRDLLDAADAALYRAKRAGRNRVVPDPNPLAMAS